jgi:hypothetical protein
MEATGCAETLVPTYKPAECHTLDVHSVNYSYTFIYAQCTINLKNILFYTIKQENALDFLLNMPHCSYPNTKPQSYQF